MSTLAEQQAALVRALVAGAAIPPGFDTNRVEVTITSLLRKRADEVARAWPAVLAGRRDRFMAWADGRPKTTSFADGLAFACAERDRGALHGPALDELHARTRRRTRRRHPIMR